MIRHSHTHSTNENQQNRRADRHIHIIRLFQISWSFVFRTMKLNSMLFCLRSINIEPHININARNCLNEWTSERAAHTFLYITRTCTVVVFVLHLIRQCVNLPSKRNKKEIPSFSSASLEHCNFLFVVVLVEIEIQNDVHAIVNGFSGFFVSLFSFQSNQNINIEKK